MGKDDELGSASNPYRPPETRPGRPEKAPRGKPVPGRSTTGFQVACDCGRTILVSASQAGSTVRCDCDAEVNVPNLGRLRESVGQDRYESGLLDTIRRMIQTGELPAGETCAVSGKPSSDVIEIEIVVTRHFKTGDDLDGVALVFLGLFAAVLLSIFRRSRYVEEESTRVRIPLIVDRRYQAKVRSMGQSRLKRLLRKVEVYEALIEENPDLKVSAIGLFD